jgi:hypothetical protein
LPIGDCFSFFMLQNIYGKFIATGYTVATQSVDNSSEISRPFMVIM